MKKGMLVFAVVVLAAWWLSGVCGAREIESPYKNLGQFVSKDGTVDQEACWREMDRQNKEAYEKCRKEALKSERELLWKNFSISSGIFHAIKEKYWDKKEKEVK